MNSNSDWLGNVKKQIDILKQTLSEKEYRKYKLPLLLCIAERLNEFSSVCGECQILQQDAATLVQDIPNLISLSDKERQKSYFIIRFKNNNRGRIYKRKQYRILEILF